jgi:cell division protein FtsW (lipid II flippase)
MSNFDLGEFTKRNIKYLIEGLLISIVCFAIPQKRLNIEEITIISLSAASIFCVLDTFLPSIAVGAKQGIGFSIGSFLGGGLRLA